MNGQVVSAPVVREKITGNQKIIEKPWGNNVEIKIPFVKQEEKMKKIFFYVIMLVLFYGCLAVKVFSAETFLDFSILRNPEELPIQGQNCVLSDTVLPDIAGQPKYVSEKPLFGSLKLGSPKTVRFFVLDESGGTGKGYDVLYFDANFNNDLSDDIPVKVVPDKYGRKNFPIKTLIDYGQGPCQYDGTITAQFWSGGRQVMLQTTGYFTGRTKFGDREYKIAVVDANGNGVFNDKTVGIRNWDIILVDEKDTGSFSAEYWSSKGYCVYRKYIKVGRDYFTAEISEDGSAINITKPDITFGTLRLNQKTFNGTVYSNDIGLFDVETNSGNISLPPGKYGIWHNIISQKDKSGREWIMETYNSRASLFEIKEGEITDFAYGEPFTVKLRQRKQGKDIYFDISFTDIAGLTYQFSRQSPVPPGSMELPTPKLKIMDNNDRLLEEKTFEFG